MSKDECERVRQRYEEFLDPEKISDQSIDDLIDILNPENPIERIAYRRKTTVSNKHEFVRVGKNTKGQFAEEKDADYSTGNEAIGFKHLKYSVPESNEYVTITIEKKIREDFSFWVRTMDDTAKAPADYESKNELITLKAHEKERNIQIKILDDDEWEPDKDFKVQLLDEVNMELLEGTDTQCTVTILDEDRPGNIGFAERFVSVRRKDQIAIIELERIDGSDGDISCLATTINDVDLLPGKQQAIEHKDFEPFVDKEIHFASNVTSVRLEI